MTRGERKEESGKEERTRRKTLEEGGQKDNENGKKREKASSWVFSFFVLGLVCVRLFGDMFCVCSSLCG